MPKKPLDPNQILGTAPAPPAAEPSTWDAMGGWPGATAAGIRGVSGLIGTGGIPGAIASGGGEALAQLIEFFGGINPDQSIAQRAGRIGTEAAVGAVPFAKVAKSGQLLRNLLRGGALSGTGEAAREYLTSGEVNPLSVGMAAGIGGGSAAGVQGLSDLLTGAASAAPKAVTPEIVPTSQTARAPRAPRPRGTASAAAPAPAPAALQIGARTPEEISADFARVGDIEDVTAPGTAYPLGIDDRVGPSVGASRAETAAASEQAAIERAKAIRQRQQDQAWEQEARNLNAAQAKQAEIDRLAEIESARAASGAEPKTTFTETVEAPTAEGGRASMSTRYATPKADKPDKDTNQLAQTLGIDPSAVTSQGGTRRFVPTPVEQVSTPVEEPLEQIANFFKSRVDASGFGNRAIKEAKAAGEAVPEAGRAAAGRALRREADEAGLPTGPGAPPFVPAAPQVGGGEAGPEWVQKELGVVEKIKQLMRDQSSGRFGGESGEVFSEIPTTLASAALGGLLGAATDPFGNPIISGLSGAAAGGLLPHVPAIARQGTEAVSDLYEKGRESLGNLPDAGETVLQAIEKIPNIQRFNLLSSFPGLVSNAYLGPYGSAVTGALERGLAGDARGWDALREVGNPLTFARDMWRNKDEAMDLLRRGELGRDEAINPGVGENLADTILAGPGWTMTAGDVTARRGLQNADFLEDEARKMTLTAEPTTGFGRTIAHFGAGGDNTPLDRLLKVATSTAAPFRRTPANIMERGFERLPGVGAAIQFAGGNRDFRELGAQQAMSAGLTGAGYLAGENIEDPWWSREARRALSNVSGQYSMPASLGFAAGRAKNQALPAQRPGTAVREMFPLPAADNLTQLGNLMFGDNPDVKPPRGAVPAFAREAIPPLGLEPLIDLEADETEALPRLPSFRRR